MILRRLAAVLVAASAAADVLETTLQQPLILKNPASVRSPGHLHGRFLHITDFHPDRFYKAHASTAEDSACHRGNGSSGYYGAETSDCDSPVTLVNATFDWLAKNVKDEIDFVIWTGDSARHDSDEEYPRSPTQIRDLNELLVRKFEEVFGRERDNDDPYDDYIVPIVPNLGNNDILPHNIFDLGPNEWTRTYLSLWRSFIPESERHEFDQSGWFTVDVIPGYLTAFSLNTMYFFTKNAAVDGCSLRSEPGYRQMEWLRVQLQFLRQSGMKAILIGHVPPARTEGKANWDETCYQKYALWMRQYRDVIVGTFYGHMNIDHFIIHDFEDIDPSLEDGYGIEARDVGINEGNFGIASASSYMTELRAKWNQLPRRPKQVSAYSSESAIIDAVADTSDDARPRWEIERLAKKGKDKKGNGKKGKGRKKHKGGKKKKRPDKKARKYLDAIGGDHAERFALSFISPSIVPNYYPTFRIFEYNITGVDYRPPTVRVDRPKVEYEFDVEKGGKKQRRRRRFTVPQGPDATAPPGPAYSPQSLSLLGYKQYYANLTVINGDFHNESVTIDSVGSFDREDEVVVAGGKWKDGKHKHRNGKTPKEGGPDPNSFKFEVLYDTKNDSSWKLHNLNVRSYVELAQRIATGFEGESSLSFEEAETSRRLISKAKKGKGKGKGKGKKKKKKGRKDRINQAWTSFVWRAFVGTLDEDQIHEQFD